MEKSKKEQLDLKLKRMLENLDRAEPEQNDTIKQYVNPVVIRRRKTGSTHRKN